MTDTDAVPADSPQKRRRYKRNTGVFRGLDLRTTRARRIRTLYASYVEQTELDGDNLIHQSAVLKVAKLQVIVERLHNELLKSKKHNQQLGDELVRHENMLRRAKEELTAMTPEPVKWWEQKDDDDAEEDE
jgi:hypothetical protein